MKTKHLFFATALVASFASCTNEDIVEQQGVANVERPTVENVKLNFVGEGVDSRLTFGSKGYAWEASDVIGALLMDQPGNKYSDKDAFWNERYTLVDYVNTSYPFSYNADTKVWSNDAKMLEGNYFFAFPFSSYNGGRDVIHSLTGQTQVGVASKAVAESYAKNQFFVGYSQIFGGTEAEDALEDVEMTSILGGLQFRIINNGTKAYHINKLVVRGDKVASELNLTPAMGSGTDFNYAVYVGDEENEDMYGLIDTEAEDFNRADLLRDLVVDKDTQAGKAQLNVTGTKAERAIAKGATGYAVVMVNPFEVATGDELFLDIYTDEGVIKDIDLTEAVVDITSDEYKDKPVLVDKVVEEVAHDVANTIVIKFADGAVGSIQEATIYDENDLLQLIEWNAKSDIKVAPEATLVENVEFTKEMFDLLKSNKNVTLKFLSTTKELTLAEGLPADVLEYEGLSIASDVTLVVAGTIALTEDTPEDIAKMIVAEEGTLNVNDAKAEIPTEIINEGTINFGEEAIAVVELTNEEEGIINIAKGADVKGADNTKFVNNGTINNNGYLEHIANNEDAVIALGEKATLKDLVNNADATVNTAKDAQVIGYNAEGALINWVTGATLNLTSDSKGMVSAEAPASVAKDAYKESFINTLRLKENTVTTFASDEPGATLNIIAAKGATLKVANGEDLTLGTLIVEEDLTIVTNNTTGTTASSLTVGTVEIAEGAELTNNGKLIVTTDWTNEGIVYNNGTTNLPEGETAETWGVFKYTAPNSDPVSTPTAQIEAMEAAIIEYMNNNYSSYSNADEYVMKEASFETHLANCPTNAGANPLGAAYVSSYGNTVETADYTTALDNVLTDNKTALVTALKTAVFVKLATDFDDDAATVTNGKTAKAKAIAAFKNAIIKSDTSVATVSGTNSVKAAAAKLTNDEVLAYINNNYVYVYDDCNLEKAVAVWKLYDNLDLNSYEYSDCAWTTNNEYAIADFFVVWAKDVLKNHSTTKVATALIAAGVDLDTVNSYSGYTNAQFKICKNEVEE